MDSICLSDEEAPADTVDSLVLFNADIYWVVYYIVTEIVQEVTKSGKKRSKKNVNALSIVIIKINHTLCNSGSYIPITIS